MRSNNMFQIKCSSMMLCWWYVFNEIVHILLFRVVFTLTNPYQSKFLMLLTISFSPSLFWGWKKKQQQSFSYLNNALNLAMIHILFIDWNTGIYLHSKAHKMTLWKFNEIQINNLNKKLQQQQQQQQTAALQHVYKSGKRKGTKRQGKKPILSARWSLCRENCFFRGICFFLVLSLNQSR